MDIISRSDEILLLSVLRLKDNAYGVTICEEVKKRTGKRLTFGSLWVSLDILHRKGLVEKKMADPTPKRGGRSKIFYSLTPAGLKALHKVQEFQRQLWQGVPSLIKGVKLTS